MWTRRKGSGRKVPVFSSRISAARFSLRLASYILMLTLSTPAAPRFRFTARKASGMRSGVILPVSECALIFFITSLSRLVITKFGLTSFRGRFLASPRLRFTRVSRQELGPTNFGSSPEWLTSLLDSRVVLRLQWFLLSLRALAQSYSGSAATLDEEATKAAFSSPPHNRVVSPVAYLLDLPTVGRRRVSPVMVQDLFLQAHARATQLVHSQHSAWLSVGRELGIPSTLRLGAVFGAPARPKMRTPGVTLPGPFVTSPSPVPPVVMRWLLTSVETAECEQGVLYGRGPAQVGFSICLSSFQRFTLFSIGRLSPEPLRLTRPEGASINPSNVRQNCIRLPTANSCSSI